MKKLRIRILALLLCICLCIPQYVVAATGGSGNTEVGNEENNNASGDNGNNNASGENGNNNASGNDGNNNASGDNGNSNASGDNGNNNASGDDGNNNASGDEGNDNTSGGGNKDNNDTSGKGSEGSDGTSGDSGKGKDTSDDDSNGKDISGEDGEGSDDALGSESEENAMLGKGFGGNRNIFGGSKKMVMMLGLMPDDPIEPESGVHGSGSYQLNSVASDYRFFTEYFVDAEKGKSIKSAGIDRRTTIKVYAKAGEYILFGSSVANSQISVDNKSTGSVTGADIVITTPSGDKISNDVLAPGEDASRPNGLGYIKNPTQEKYGPMVNHADENDSENKYYVPLQYKVTTSGVYTFEFHSVNGYNYKTSPPGQLPSHRKAGEDWLVYENGVEKNYQGNTSVAAWDVTVLGKNKDNTDLWEVKAGRAWADYLALTTADGAPYKSDLNVHVLTHDGYQYKVDFREAMPFGFIFFANNTGFMSATTDDEGNTTYSPIYHSFYDASNDLDGMSSIEKIYLHKPDEVDTATQETYKIFFNAPNEDLDEVEYYRNNRLEKIRTKPKDSVTIGDLRFNASTHENIARTGHGGYFTFTADDEATVTIRLDLRKAIAESGASIEKAYKGSGIVEITAPAVEGNNSVYWDGKDTDGIVIPAGIYGNSNVVLATEVKRGELHFPCIDMEGLTGGLTVKRIDPNDPTSDADSLYDLYYNNNPLVFGNIEGEGYSTKYDGAYYVLSDGTKSNKSFTDRSATKAKYFKDVAPLSISTLKKDDKYYLAKELFDTDFDSLDSVNQAIILAELGKMQDTFHHEAVNSKITTMKFNCEGFDGGGNQAGIDAWTYYTQGINSQKISFAILDTNERGVVKGQIFYDANVNSIDDAGDFPLSGVKVRLVDSTGKPLVHKEKLPDFDETGNFVYNKDGSIKFVDQDVEFDSITDSTGTYRFTGVPFSSTDDTKYYVQVMLSDVQSEVMRYTCTTSAYIQAEFKDGSNKFITADLDNDAWKNVYGPDGNEVTDASDDPTKIYKHKYKRDSNQDIVFKTENAQSVTFLKTEADSGDVVVEKYFKKIGFSSTVRPENQKDYKVEKSWGTDSQGHTSDIADGLIVELWVWNDNDVQEVNTHDLTRRTGALVDTQVLNTDNEWSYTWRNLDDRLKYFVLEYYTKKKPDGEVIYNDKGEPRRVLIGGTMPIYGAESTIPSNNIYGFDISAGEYPETITVDGKTKIPVQKFGDGKTHQNALTDKEKLESVDNNARQYDVKYTLTKQTFDGRATNVISLKNSQVYDDRAYYVWLNHETQLPDMIALTYVEKDGSTNEKKSHAVSLVKDDLAEPIAEGVYPIKGLSVSSVDAASGNTEGNATRSFQVKETDKKYAYFTATNKESYKTGTGTRTYRVKYVVKASDKTTPVSVTTDENHDLVETGTGTKVEGNINYVVYSWYMTIHVYDLVSDGVIEYDPKGGIVTLQKALNPGDELKWELKQTDINNENVIEYTSTDKRTGGILTNDTYRLPLYKHAVNPDMGTCADIVGIAWAGSFPCESDEEVAGLEFADTYESLYGDKDSEDGKAVADGSNGSVEIVLNTTRTTRINRTQDHANYADIKFTPFTQGGARAAGTGEDVFYYKVAVFSEDSTYQYYSYDDINALEGVVMYAYFTMKPKATLPNNNGITPAVDKDPTFTQEDYNEVSNTTVSGKNTSEVKVRAKSPKTGDDNNLILWFSIIILSLAIVAIGATKRNKC